MTNVYSSVKKNYKSAEHLMLCSTKAYICSAFMNWAEFDTPDGVSKNIVIPDNSSSKAEKKQFIDSTISKFVEEYILVEFNIETMWRDKLEKQREAEQESTNQASLCPYQLIPGNYSNYSIYIFYMSE